MVLSFGEFEAAITRGSPDVLIKWQTIQENLHFLPNNALRDLIVDLVRTWQTPKGPVITQAVVDVIDDWYRRALFAKAQRESPEDPILTDEQWRTLPDRWFDGPPRLTSL